MCTYISCLVWQKRASSVIALKRKKERQKKKMEEIERKSTKKEEIFFHTLVLLPQLAWPFVLRLVLSPLSFFPILIWRLLSSGAQGASGHPTAYKIAFFSSSFDAFVFFFLSFFFHSLSTSFPPRNRPGSARPPVSSALCDRAGYV